MNKNKKNNGFISINMAIVIAVVFITGLTGIQNYVNSSKNSNAAMNGALSQSLSSIDGDKPGTPTATPTPTTTPGSPEDTNKYYIMNGETLECPSGGCPTEMYRTKTIASYKFCSISGSVWGDDCVRGSLYIIAVSEGSHTYKVPGTNTGQPQYAKTIKMTPNISVANDHHLKMSVNDVVQFDNIVKGNNVLFTEPKYITYDLSDKMTEWKVDYQIDPVSGDDVTATRGGSVGRLPFPEFTDVSFIVDEWYARVPDNNTPWSDWRVCVNACPESSEDISIEKAPTVIQIGK